MLEPEIINKQNPPKRFLGDFGTNLMYRGARAHVSCDDAENFERAIKMRLRHIVRVRQEAGLELDFEGFEDFMYELVDDFGQVALLIMFTKFYEFMVYEEVPDVPIYGRGDTVRIGDHEGKVVEIAYYFGLDEKPEGMDWNITLDVGEEYVSFYELGVDDIELIERCKP